MCLCNRRMAFRQRSQNAPAGTGLALQKMRVIFFYQQCHMSTEDDEGPCGHHLLYTLFLVSCYWSALAVLLEDPRNQCPGVSQVMTLPNG